MNSFLICILILFSVYSMNNALFFNVPQRILSVADNAIGNAAEIQYNVLKQTQNRIRDTNAKVADGRQVAEQKRMDRIKEVAKKESDAQIARGVQEMQRKSARLSPEIRECFNEKNQQNTDAFKRNLTNTIQRCLTTSTNEGKRDMDTIKKNMNNYNKENTESKDDCRTSQNKANCYRNASTKIRENIAKIPMKFGEFIKSFVNAIQKTITKMLNCRQQIGNLITENRKNMDKIVQECEEEAAAATTTTTTESTTTTEETTTVTDETTTVTDETTTAATDETTTAATDDSTTNESTTGDSTTTVAAETTTTVTETTTNNDSTTTNNDSTTTENGSETTTTK